MKSIDIEYLHSEKYGQAIKIAKRFTGDGKTRPILSFVLHDKDGSIVATDSHRALRIKNIHGFKEDFLIHPHTIDFAKGNFPDVNHVFDQKNSKINITLSKEQVRIWLQMHKSINQLITKVYGKYTPVLMELGEDITFKIKGEDGVNFKLPFLEYQNTEDKIKVTYEPEYMRDALETHTTMGSNQVNIVINGAMNPITVKNNDDVDVVVLPVRTY